MRCSRPIELDEKALDLALEILRSGGVVIFPTDTLYGLLASVENREAVDRVFEIKRRPKGKPIPVLVGSFGVAQRYGEFTPEAVKLWERFMPGALTLVVRCKEGLSEGIVSKEGTVGLRMPNFPPLLKVLGRLGCGVVGTSANLAGEPPAKELSELDERLFNMVDAVFYTRERLIGVPSTVVQIAGGKVKILREGGVSPSEIEDVLREKD